MMKRTISFLLVMTLLFSCIFPVGAKSEGCGCGFSPIVYVAALGSATLYLDAGTENEKIIFRPEQKTTLNLAGKLILPAVRLAVDRNYDAFAASLAKEVKNVFGELAMDADGNSSSRVTTKTTLPTDPAHGPDNDYYFGYDFRIDPLITAEKLDAYVKHVKALTGHDKVSLKASSLGGIIVLAYLEKFGTAEIDACIFQCCPLLGVAVAGDLFTKQIELNSDALVRYGVQVLPQVEYGELLEPVIRLLDTVGVFDSVIGLGGKLIANMKDRLYDELLIPVFGRMPGLWSMVPDVSYRQAKEIFLKDGASQALIDRLDDYHYNVQCKAKEILTGAKADGVRIMILAGYNFQREPFVASYLNNSDAVDDTIYNAPGVICAQITETLGEGYTQKIDDGHNHLSADGVIDASTCFLPENTWFAKDMLHSTTHAGHKAFYTWFLLGDTSYDVHTDARYPQFLQNDIKNSKLIPLMAETDKALIFDVVFELISKLLKMS